MSAITLEKIGQGKLWQFTEMAAMIGVGTAAMRYLNQDLPIAISFCTLNFIAGKAAYGVTRAFMQPVSSIFARTDQMAGWTAAIAVGAYAGKWFLHCQKINDVSFASCLLLTLVCGPIAAGVREAFYQGIMKTVVSKA